MFIIREFLLADYAAAYLLWQSTEEVGLNESDSEQAIGEFLLRNPKLSAVAMGKEGELVGAVLCGHDGRRGYLHHLAVARAYRRQGIGHALLDHCFAELAKQHVQKCNIFLYANNTVGQAFWLHNGWHIRETLRLVQKSVPHSG
ncbi:MAG TPA: N-acetyltransferase [Tepidisphaeraceae bacterium]|jgi:putative acetyltransferase|nr:N-acetyltransferase [Tepidisphaeraceae bacterium]